MSRYLFIAFLFLVAGPLRAQQQLEVNLRDQTSGEPLFLAYVNTYSETGRLIQSLQTNELGRVTFRQDPEFSELELVAPGYLSLRMSRSQLGPGPTRNFSLERKYAHLHEVVITGLNQPQRMKDALSSYKVITRAQIQAQGAANLDDLLRTQLNMRVSEDAVLGSSVGMQGLS